MDVTSYDNCLLYKYWESPLFFGVQFLNVSWLYHCRVLRNNERYLQHHQLPPGLPNLSGNLCFINALLQGLASFPSLTNLLQRVCNILNDDNVTQNNKKNYPVSSNGFSQEYFNTLSLLNVLQYLNNMFEFNKRTHLFKNCNTIEISKTENNLQAHFQRLKRQLEYFYSTSLSVDKGVKLETLGQQDLHEALQSLIEHVQFVVLQDVYKTLRFPLQKLLDLRLRQIGNVFFSSQLFCFFASHTNVCNLVSTPGIVFKFDQSKTLSKQQEDIKLNTHITDALEAKSITPLCLSCTFMKLSYYAENTFLALQKRLSGYSKHSLQCLTCGIKTTAKETKYIIIEVPLPEYIKCSTTLKTLLELEYVQPNIIEGVECPNCFLEYLVTNKTDNLLDRIDDIRQVQYHLQNGETWEVLTNSRLWLKELCTTDKMIKKNKLSFNYLKTLPHCLTFHILRQCSSVSICGEFTKNTLFVSVPPVINLSFLLNNSNDCLVTENQLEKAGNKRCPGKSPELYELRAIVEHVGLDSANGHFLTYRRWDTSESPFQLSLSSKFQTFKASGKNESCRYCFNANDLGNSTQQRNHQFSTEKIAPIINNWKWVCISDHSVWQVTTAYVLSRQAYILHYEKWFSE